ncbi:MAG: hypothetical protein WEC83_01715 [Patescibacteria group bacterium]
MLVLLSDVTAAVPKLSWSATKLAEKLSLIGHEATVTGRSLDITLTANRQDCRALPYLMFDLLAVYPELGDNKNLITFKPGKIINVTLDQVNGLLGSDITKQQYHGLSRLGFVVEDSRVTVPDFRVDMNDAADIAEEVFRLYGPAALRVVMLAKESSVKYSEYDRELQVRAALVGAGFNETRTVSFAAAGELSIKNPFNAALPYLRANLLDGLLQSLAKNPFIRRAAFFEIGNVFLPDEQTSIGVIFSGNKDQSGLEKILTEALGTAIKLTSPTNEQLHSYGVKQPSVFYGELALEDVVKPATELTVPKLPSFKKISKFSPLVRDVSITSSAGSGFVDKLPDKFPELLFVEQIDSYTDPDTKHVTDTYRLIFQKLNSTFTQDEIAAIDQRVDQHFFKNA